ncbi:MAG TPA: hypothetical protein VF033_17210 [Steroidobacteraceae bacterium]
MSERPRARLQSLCGTARGIASKKSTSEVRTPRKPCRYAAIWACQSTSDCSRRMSDRR